MSLVWITKVNYLTDYQIEIEFNNNKKGVVDFQKHLDLQIYQPLKELNNFKNFKLNSWIIEWENGADFSPEFLYSKIN